MNLNGFALEIDCKAITDAGEFTGYASTFGNQDFDGDIVVAGAFAKSLQRRPAEKVKMLRGHGRGPYTDEPVGIWTDLIEDGKGLLAKGRLILGTIKGKETYALMKAGALDSLSIGYRTIKHRLDRAKSLRYLEELDLPEISIVTFPANDAATISAVKANLGIQLVDEINRIRGAFK